MKIERIIIKNYKIYESLDFSVQNVNNVFVGNNGSGKTTLLESIYLALTGRLDNQNIDNLLTPDMFTNKVRRQYIDQLKKAEPAKLPKIIIEVYFKDEDDYAPLKGSENSQETDCPGIRFECSFDSQFADEYKSRLEVKQNNSDDFKVLDIPIEYYCVKRTYFSGQPVIQRTNPFKVFFVDGTRKSYANYIGKYIYSTIGSLLSEKESSQIRTVYENIRQNLKQHSVLQKFNNDNKENLHLAGKNVALTVRESLPDDWLQEITVSVDQFPFDNIGFGLQKMIELELAVGKSSDKPGILLFEEPENNLSYPNMSKLINILERGSEKQKFISTHSSFVANKLGLGNLVLCGDGIMRSLSDLNEADIKYFKRLPGYNTLRVLLSSCPILVEGPTDELLFNAAYLNKHNKLPIEDGIDIIVVDSLAFKRYLDVAKLIKKRTVVITDNDGDIEKLHHKYKGYLDNPLFKFCIEKDPNLHTLEPSMIHANMENGTIKNLAQVVYGKEQISEDVLTDKLETYMTGHKSLWSMRVLEKNTDISYPDNINQAIKECQQ